MFFIVLLPFLYSKNFEMTFLSLLSILAIWDAWVVFLSEPKGTKVLLVDVPLLGCLVRLCCCNSCKHPQGDLDRKEYHLLLDQGWICLEYIREICSFRVSDLSSVEVWNLVSKFSSEDLEYLLCLLYLLVVREMSLFYQSSLLLSSRSRRFLIFRCASKSTISCPLSAKA